VTLLTVFAGPAAFALFLWWFSTGLILYLDGLPRSTFRWSLLGATLLLALGVYGLAATAGDDSVQGAYLAFASALLVWGWLEITFYLGFITGPRRHACAPGCAGWRHFGHAIQVSLWHELAILTFAAVIVALTWNQPNTVGLWSFVVLWWMHESARLNVFLGVRNVNAEFLPAHLDFLKSFLKQGTMNFLFPISITVTTAIFTLLAAQALDPTAIAFARVEHVFLATLMGLAIVEHWFLILPLPFARLWQWYLTARQRAWRPRRQIGQANPAGRHLGPVGEGIVARGGDRP